MIWTMNRINILANITADMERGTLDQASFDYLKECALQLDRAMQIARISHLVSAALQNYGSFGKE